MIYEIKQNRELTKDLKSSILDIKNILTVFTIILFIVSLFYRLVYLSSNEAYILSGNGYTYVDTYFIAGVYRTVYLLECLLAAAISVKLLIFLKLNDYIRLFYTTIENGFVSFARYSLFFIVIIFGYTVISHIIWGPFLKDYASLGTAFIQVLMLSMGKKINFIL